MPRVPYNPVPDVTPQSPGEQVSIATPGAAFGENIGEALKQLGGTVESASSELFTRAQALQELKNENDARDAQSEFATESSKLHAQYNALSGKEAADGLDSYLKAQADLRMKIRGQLQTPMAQQHYDSDSLPFMQRNVFSAAGHAAEENKQYTIKTYRAQTDITKKAVSNDPFDEGFIDQQRAKLIHDSTQSAMLAIGTDDPNSPVVKDAVMKDVSDFVKARLTGMALIDPIKTYKEFEKYSADLIPTDKDAIQRELEGRAAATAGYNIAKDVIAAHRQPDGTYDVTSAQLQQEAEDRAKKLMPTNSALPQVAVRNIDGIVNQQRWAQRVDVTDAQKTFGDLLANNNITNTQQLLAFPNAAQLVERLPPEYRANLQAKINQFWFSSNHATDEVSMTLINAMKTDPVQYQSIDPLDPKYRLSQPHIREIQNEQAKMARVPSSDPRVMRAINWVKQTYSTQLGPDGLGIYDADGKRTDSDSYFHFVGALQEALQIYQEDHKTVPDYKTITEEIAPQIISRLAPVSHWYGTRQEPAFKQFQTLLPEEIPLDYARQATEEAVKAGLPPPTQKQIQMDYLRREFNKLYGRSSSSTGATAPTR